MEFNLNISQVPFLALIYNQPVVGKLCKILFTGSWLLHWFDDCFLFSHTMPNFRKELGGFYFSWKISHRLIFNYFSLVVYLLFERRRCLIKFLLCASLSYHDTTCVPSQQKYSFTSKNISCHVGAVGRKYLFRNSAPIMIQFQTKTHSMPSDDETNENFSFYFVLSFVCM